MFMVIKELWGHDFVYLKNGRVANSGLGTLLRNITSELAQEFLFVMGLAICIFLMFFFCGQIL